MSKSWLEKFCKDMNKVKPIDLGEVCVHCKDSVKFGSGKFVDRYPVFGLEDEGIEYDGYCCAECEESYYSEFDEMRSVL